MNTYILKMILCSGIFYGLYQLAFRNEKMMKFNRFYLLGGLLFSLIIPLITITETVLVQQQIANEVESNITTTPLQIVQSVSNEIDWVAILPLIFSLISFVFLLRFVKNILNIRNLIYRNESIHENGIRIILTKIIAPPFSFMNYIFLNKTEYESGEIEHEVMAHEMAHVTQKHSWDVLFIGLLQIVLWFNPFLYLYKRSIKTNHELLADDAVARQQKDISRYQSVILRRTVGLASLSMSSSFNFLTTKKRLVMLQKQKHPAKAFLKSLLVVPVLASMIIVFHQKSYAVQPIIAIRDTVTPVHVVGDNPLLEYEKLLKKYGLEGDVVKNFTKKRSQVSENDMQKMISLYLQLTHEERIKNRTSFIKHSAPFKKVNVSDADLRKWENGKIYGVWIDEKRIDNIKLKDYKGADFSLVFVSKLSKNAINYGKHYYQVDLMTNAYYEKYYKEAKALEGTYFMVISFKVPISEK